MSLRQAYLDLLVSDVEQNLARFDNATGRFLTEGGWGVFNQDIIYSLALLYHTENQGNPYYHSPKLRECILRGGDAWRDFQYPDGRWEFIKVDGSTWGPYYEPWSVYHWLETYVFMRNELDPERKARWEAGLILCYNGIATELEKAEVHNLTLFNAASIYRAGQVFGRSDWMTIGERLMHMAIPAQTPQGYWREHHGPTTFYNHIYVHAIGLYYEFSGDQSVLPCLEKATDFHIRYTYPDGRPIETIDGRVKYHDKIQTFAHAAFSLFPQGRRYIRFLVEQMQAQDRSPHISYMRVNGQRKVSAADYGLSPYLATAYVYLREGPEAPIPQDNAQYQQIDPGHAIVRRQDGWLYCLSGIVTPSVDTRWGMDRQSFISIWHDHCHLIVGGGNSKWQPEWSNFSFKQDDKIIYLPDAITLQPGTASDRMQLDYSHRLCTLAVRILDNKTLKLRFSAASGSNTTARLLFHMHPGAPIITGKGESFVADENLLVFNAAEDGGCFSHNGWKVSLPPGSSFTWPQMPYNPYEPNGISPLDQAVGALVIPLTGQEETIITIEITQ